MSNIYINKLDRFISILDKKFSNHNDRITICAVATAQYVNYLLDKGYILNSEKGVFHSKAIDLIEIQFDSPIPDFVKNGLKDIMDGVSSYEYEIIAPIIKLI